MKTNVTSTDSRKPQIVAMLKKQVVGCTKVTLLKQIGPGLFEGHCLKSAGNRTFESIGTHEVRIPELMTDDETKATDAKAIVEQLMATVVPGDTSRPTDAEISAAIVKAVAPKRKDGKPRILVVTDKIVAPKPKPEEPKRIFTADEKAFFKRLGLQEDGNTPLPRAAAPAPVTGATTTTDGKPMNPAQKAWATRRARAAAKAA